MTDDSARLDAYIAAVEHGDPGNTTDPEVMEMEHHRLLAAGLLEPDEPTPWSHYRYLRIMEEAAEMGVDERRLWIDALLSAEGHPGLWEWTP